MQCALTPDAEVRIITIILIMIIIMIMMIIITIAIIMIIGRRGHGLETLGLLAKPPLEAARYTRSEL